MPDVSLLVLGTRTLALEIADLASDVPGLRVAGFVENMEPERCGGQLAGLPVHWVDEVEGSPRTTLQCAGLRRRIAAASSIRSQRSDSASRPSSTPPHACRGRRRSERARS